MVLKQDGMGRVKMPVARREHLLDEYEHSGLSGAKFAALAGIKYSTFASWAQRRRRQRCLIFSYTALAGFHDLPLYAEAERIDALSGASRKFRSGAVAGYERYFVFTQD